MPSKTREEAPMASKPEPKIKIKGWFSFKGGTVKLSTKKQESADDTKYGNCKESQNDSQSSNKDSEQSHWGMAIPWGMPMVLQEG